MSCWTFLGIEPTEDEGEIKRVYLEMLPLYHPEEDPDGFRKLRMALEEALREAEQIILYGAGQLGRRAATKLLEMGLEEKILFAAETTGDGTGKLFHFPVKNAREILPCKDTALVLVAAGRKNSPQIIRYLEGLGITNYLGVENLHLWY